jgi:hypothetical protein
MNNWGNPMVMTERESDKPEVNNVEKKPQESPEARIVQMLPNLLISIVIIGYPLLKLQLDKALQIEGQMTFFTTLCIMSILGAISLLAILKDVRAARSRKLFFVLVALFIADLIISIPRTIYYI